MSDADLSKWPDLQQALRDLPCGIGKAIPLVKAAPVMEQVLRDIAFGYMDILPEEITEPIKVALDLLDGGDGVIYR